MAGAKKALKLNPILKKELRLGSRSIKIPMFVMGYDIVLSLIAVISILIISIANREGEADFSNYLYIYQIIGWTQLGITLIIVPILTAGTISGERERQTLDIMLTTPKKPLSIVWGKMTAALSNYMIFIISSIPIMAIAFILGGLNWFALLGYFAMMIVVAIYVGSIGVFCSSAFKRTIASVVMTFLISFALLIIPYILFLTIVSIAGAWYSAYYYSYSYVGAIPDLNLGILPMIMLLNPISGFFDYMMQTMDITSVHELLKEADCFGTIMPILGYAWIPMNLIVCGAISYFFIRMAARKLNPIKKIKRKKAAVTGPVGMQPQVNPVPVQPVPQLYQPNQQTVPVQQTTPVQQGVPMEQQVPPYQSAAQPQETASELQSATAQPQETVDESQASVQGPQELTTEPQKVVQTQQTEPTTERLQAGTNVR